MKEKKSRTNATSELNKLEKKIAEGRVKPFAIKPDKIHISFSMTGKLDKVAALSTPVHLNPICKTRIAAGNSVCAHCYASSIIARDNVRPYLEENYRILTTRELSDVEIQELVFQVRYEGRTEFRIEAFGDCANNLQAENYIRICAAMNAAGIPAGLWTKNPAFYDRAIKKYGKPAMTKMILSSCGLNKPDTHIAIQYNWIDRVFTVYSDEDDANYAIMNGAIQCHAEKGSCHMTCRHCYNGVCNDGLKQIVEILK